MSIRPAPIREPIFTVGGFVSHVWALWFQKLVSRINEGDGISGTFTTVDGKTITVSNGIVTDIS